MRPEAIGVMKEIGIDITSHRSKHADEFTGQPFDYVLTVCDNARESCPSFPATVRLIHHSSDDPAAAHLIDAGSEAERLALFRRERDEIRLYLQTFPGRQEL